MFGQPKTCDEIAKETGKKGKELSQHLREITQNGGGNTPSRLCRSGQERHKKDRLSDGSDKQKP